MSSGDDGAEEVTRLGIPSLRLVDNAMPRYDEAHASIIRDVAEMTAAAITQKAVQDVTEAFAQASQWLINDLRNELISQTVGNVTPSSACLKQKNEQIPVAAPPEHDEIHRLTFQPSIATVHAVAKVTVEAITSEAVQGVTHAVEHATEWLTQAVRIELISQTVTPDVKTVHQVDLSANANIAPYKELAVQNVAKWIAQAVHNAQSARAVADATLSCDHSVAFETERHCDLVPELTKLNGIPHISLPPKKTPVEGIHELAKATVDAAVRRAIQIVAQAMVDTSERSIQSVSKGLLDQAVIGSSAEDHLGVEDAEPLKRSYPDSEVPRGPHIPSGTSDKPVHIPELRIPQSRQTPYEVGKCLDVAASFVDNLMSSALQRMLFPRSLVGPQDDEEEYYTPIPTPTSVDTPREENPAPIPAPATKPEPVPPITVPATPPDPESVLPTTMLDPAPAPEPQHVPPITKADPAPATESEPIPPISTPAPALELELVPPITSTSAQLIEKATPPETKSTPRRKIPITTNRGLGTPRSQENYPTSAPPALPASPVINETPITSSELAPLPSPLPPLILHGVHGALPSGRIKHHQHKTPRTTSQPSSPPCSNKRADFLIESPRAATTDSSRPNKKYTPRASIELELSPLSSARAAALIYAQQLPSSRQYSHHHHKPKKLQDSASQTSPPPSPPPHYQNFMHEGNHDSSELPMTSQKKHSLREISSPDNENDGKMNPTLLPLPKPPVTASTTKSPSPSRVNKKHNQSHSRKEDSGSGALSPTKTRSGYCQRCVFEGRSCKINDCLKHQVLPQMTHK